jgi:hypothetical protein
VRENVTILKKYIFAVNIGKTAKKRDTDFQENRQFYSPKSGRNRQFIRRKVDEIAKNRDHNIDPIASLIEKKVF